MALGKGTVVLLETTDDHKIYVNEKLFVGERISEGYGEVEILQEICEDVVIRKETSAENMVNTNYKSDIIQRLSEMQEAITLRILAREAADKFFKNVQGNEDYTATLGKLILLSKTTSGMTEIDEQIKGIEIASKRAVAQKIIEQLKHYVEKYAEEKVYQVALPEYLARIKYLMRAKKGENK